MVTTVMNGNSDDEMRRMLRAERTNAVRRVAALKHEIRERAAELKSLEDRLDDIEASESCLEIKTKVTQ
jgi:septal ring factor EnvC (AmiA/AmiB activator)